MIILPAIYFFLMFYNVMFFFFVPLQIIYLCMSGCFSANKYLSCFKGHCFMCTVQVACCGIYIIIQTGLRAALKPPNPHLQSRSGEHVFHYIEVEISFAFLFQILD